MKTVLFIDKTEEDLWASFQKYDYLLDEYRNDPMTRKIFQAAAECEGLYYGALYQHGMYYRRIMQPGFPPERPRTGKGAQP